MNSLVRLSSTVDKVLQMLPCFLGYHNNSEQRIPAMGNVSITVALDRHGIPTVVQSPSCSTSYPSVEEG